MKKRLTNRACSQAVFFAILVGGVADAARTISGTDVIVEGQAETTTQPATPQERNVASLLRMSDEDRAIVELFRLGSDIVPELVRHLRSVDLRPRVGRALAYAGDPAGLMTLLAAVRAESELALKAELSAYLAGGLVQAHSREYLDFLRSCVERYRGDETDAAAASAALSLGAMGTPAARAILSRARNLDEENLTHHEIAKAKRWVARPRIIKGYPLPKLMGGEDGRVAETALANAFFAESEESGLAVETVTWTPRRDRALAQVVIRHNGTLAREYHVIVERAPEAPDGFRIAAIWLTTIA